MHIYVEGNQKTMKCFASLSPILSQRHDGIKRLKNFCKTFCKKEHQPDASFCDIDLLSSMPQHIIKWNKKDETGHIEPFLLFI